ncbi:hypothetical protein HDV00_002480 [Rhizophlyctis rosea]|nr:hypothetical protein HDV00_002480 [Rhizophlyctis rosea]
MTNLGIPPLPIVDITPLADPSQPETARRSVVEQLSAACVYHGAFYVKSADIGGLTREFRSQVLDSARALFAVDDAVKEEFKVVREKGREGLTRGYIAMGTESGSDALEVKEAFSYGCPTITQPTNALSGPNIWPNPTNLSPPTKQTLETFFTSMVKVAETLTSGLSLALGYPASHLHDNYCKNGETISLMRLFRYFPATKTETLSPDDRNRATGSSPHTDWGFLTLILQQDGVTGLQIATPNPEDPSKTEWVDVPPIPGTLLVNAGDYLSLLTNGRVVSPLHRVIVPQKERLSAVFFYYPDYDARIPILSGEGEEGDTGSIARLSLFKNQSEELEEIEAIKYGGATAAPAAASEVPPKLKLDPKDVSNMAFGEYIAAKWAQVARGGYS